MLSALMFLLLPSLSAKEPDLTAYLGRPLVPVPVRQIAVAQQKRWRNQGGVKLSKNTLQMSNSKFLQHALKMSKMQFYTHARSKFLTSDLICGQYRGFVFTILVLRTYFA